MDLDLQYSPSKWVVRMRPEDVVADHMATTVARTLPPCRDAAPMCGDARCSCSGCARVADTGAEAAARASGGVVERDVRYGDAPGALLDLYHPPPTTTPTAVVAYIHGGYWQALGSVAWAGHGKGDGAGPDRRRGRSQGGGGRVGNTGDGGCAGPSSESGPLPGPCLSLAVSRLTRLNSLLWGRGTQQGTWRAHERRAGSRWCGHGKPRLRPVPVRWVGHAHLHQHGPPRTGRETGTGTDSADVQLVTACAVTIPAIVAEIVQAVRWLQTRFPGLPLIVGGHSAGAHLAAAALLELGDAHGVSGTSS